MTESGSLLLITQVQMIPALITSLLPSFLSSLTTSVLTAAYVVSVISSTSHAAHTFTVTTLTHSKRKYSYLNLSLVNRQSLRLGRKVARSGNYIISSFSLNAAHNVARPS
jgi:hypothetical protein